MKEETIHYKVMIYHINFACGIWPYKEFSPEYLPSTKDKSKVTCGNCKRARAYKIKNFNVMDIIRGN